MSIISGDPMTMPPPRKWRRSSRLKVGPFSSAKLLRNQFPSPPRRARRPASPRPRPTTVAASPCAAPLAGTKLDCTGPAEQAWCARRHVARRSRRRTPPLRKRWRSAAPNSRWEVTCDTDHEVTTSSSPSQPSVAFTLTVAQVTDEGLSPRTTLRLGQWWPCGS